MRRPLRLAFVCYPTFGGSGVVASELAMGMARRQHHVHLLSTLPPGRLLPDGAPVFFHQVSVAEYPLFDHSPYALAMASKIVEVAGGYRLDIVHVHYSVPHATSAYLARQVLGKRAPRIVTTLHGTDVTRVGVDPSLQSINRFSVASSDAVTVPSRFLRDAAKEMLGLPEHFPIQVVPNFVDPDAFSPANPRYRRHLDPLFENGPDTPVLIHVSNFRPVKRVPDLVDVLARVIQKTPVRLLLVGDGPDRSRAAQRARALGVFDRISFVGTVGHFVDYLRHADLFLLPSETESFGLAALEALSAGVPVIAYRVGGLPEVIRHNQVGLLTPPHNIDAMANAVVELLSDPERQEHMRRAARAHVIDKYGPKPALDRYEHIYRRILQGEAPTDPDRKRGMT